VAYDTIAYDVDDRVLMITLDRPDRLNAFTSTMMAEVVDAFDRADADDDVRAVIVTGRGRAFCAGADLEAGADTFHADAREDEAERSAHRAAAAGGDEEAGLRDGGGLVSLRIHRSLKPVIAAINGPAVGVGITMTLPMDVRLASTDARMGFVFSRRGLVPEACSTWFLPRVVGISRAAEWCFSGRVFDADEALAGGLVRSLHAPDELLGAARELATEIAANTSALSVTLTRQMLWQMLGADHPMEAHKIDSRAIRSLGSSPEAAEGVTSFLEKRPPRFAGKVSTDMPDFFPWWTDPSFS